ncbi:DUF3883 domain-containing protein [Dinoroseobacter sp. PD6]|uniref:sacsin N-terminal ATP-binding-like domain-containing protein n=1 Tax=Dinoroseobacter sp. PD6 TaxID=3028384 RepID=UPI00237BD785|nr:DUF3883 domain-containing protein [Dinoroseobacter sp. PD6]MDD9718668.1 DUF3883 domain-containing protein [Dinoroseobacter sp. PD6]
MNFASELASLTPAEALRTQARNALSNALDAHRKGQQVYESLKNLGEVIGTEYGDRVLFELIQNAHDAHSAGEDGGIAIKLAVTSETEGRLYVANRGHGFRDRDVSAIINLATSGKEIGEGIGNKGLGFRSIEAITEDVQIYSRSPNQSSKSFDGFCFRFARRNEIRDIILSELRDEAVREDEADRISNAIPRYLVPRPLDDIPSEIARYANLGYATVIVAPLRSSSAVNLVRKQVEEIANLEHPLLLFLDRIAEVRIDVEIEGKRTGGRRLTRRQKVLRESGGPDSPEISEVEVGEHRRFLLVRQEVEKERVIAAVRDSIDRAPALKRWIEWRGQPCVSVAVGLSTAAVLDGQLYNFLPMGSEAGSPLLGHIDAPFFADIDRRNTDLELPLNSHLMDAVAEACVSGALAVVREQLDIPGRSVFDLIAWTGGDARKLDAAVKAAGLKLSELNVIPIIPTESGEKWSNLENISIWPDAKFALLKPREIVKHVGVHLASGDLNNSRLERLREMAGRCFGRYGWRYSRLPSPDEIPEWSAIYARTLVDRDAKPATWSKFYNDLATLCEASEVDLDCLDGVEVLIDRSGKLRSAGGHDADGRHGLYVRSESEIGKRRKGGIPLPPSSLTRGYRFFDEKIGLSDEVLKAFADAGLIRKFDPIEALSGLGSALGKAPSDKRRVEALDWAFRVWDAAGKSAEAAIKSADLHVPTLGGWIRADNAVFSGTWTEAGRRLEAYLSDASAYSEDCERARKHLLKPLDEWETRIDAGARKWVTFLEVIEVADGLKPIAAKVRRRGSPSGYWDNLLRRGDLKNGLGEPWTRHAGTTTFRHPNTDDYALKGEFWRMPGQNEYDELPEHLREAFYELLVQHLSFYGRKFLSARIGRYDRAQREWDERRVVTPLGAFLRSEAWLQGDLRGERIFLSPNQCWASRTKRPGVPAFIPRLSDDARVLVEREEIAKISFGDALGLLDWAKPETAPLRLAALANSARNLQSGDVATFRRQYGRAWGELAESGATLPSDLPLAVYRSGNLASIEGDKAEPIEVILVDNAQSFEARALSAAGIAILEVGDADLDIIVESLKHINGYSPSKLDRASVRLLVDGSVFVPRNNDDHLVSQGLDWLPELAVIANEVAGENLERGIQHATLDKGIRAIRLRRCSSISLQVADQEVTGGGRMDWYAFRDDASPTLILTHGVPLDWPRLAMGLASEISKLTDTRLRSLELVLLRLAIGRPEGTLERPSDAELATALGCDIGIVEDMRAGMRTDLAHILYLMVPVVAYFEGAELARALGAAAEDMGAEFSLRGWLETHLSENSPPAGDLLAACEESPDRRSVLTTLGLDYGKFNRVLQSLGEEALSSEAELRATFEAYLRELVPGLRDRLRCLHLEDYRQGRDLSTYLSRRELQFIQFDPSWVLDCETLDRQTVVTHVERSFADALGEIPEADLPAFEKMISENRKVVHAFASEAKPILGAWTRKNHLDLPEIWEQGEAQEVVRLVENAGFLDFEVIKQDQVASLCERAGIWPAEMPARIDPEGLGLDEGAVREEQERKAREQQERDRRKRIIQFAGQDLDPGDPSFAVAMQNIAEAAIESDDSWFERSRQRTRLVPFDETSRSDPGGGNGGGGKRVQRAARLTETQKVAMGVASEWLAYQYLKRRFPEAVGESSWISENRTKFFGGSEGDDSAGYDFLVQTPTVDWMFEVKSTLEDGCEFELTSNELRVASSASRTGRRRYRILYVPHVFSPEKWCVFELPNPMDKETQAQFSVVGRGSLRLRFERR